MSRDVNGDEALAELRESYQIRQEARRAVTDWMAAQGRTDNRYEEAPMWGEYLEAANAFEKLTRELLGGTP